MRFLILLVSGFMFLSTNAQVRVVVDGKFEEWEALETAYADEAGDEGFSGIDFGDLKISNDDNFVFFYFENTKEFNIQNGNNVNLYIDTDLDESTGVNVSGIGAELQYSFAQRLGTVLLGGNSYTVFHEDLQLVTAPTVSSQTFEIAIKRNISFGGNPLFPNDDFRLIIRDNGFSGDAMPSTDGGIQYTFSTEVLDPLPQYSIQKLNNNHLRFLSYNVLFDGIMEQSRSPSFKRILQAIQPDIIGFQEIYNSSSLAVAAQVETMLPSGPGETWYHAKGGPDNHVISRYPVLQSFTIEGANSNQGNGAFLLDLPGDQDELLFIVAHTPCCENDAARQIEVDAIMAFIRDAKNGTGPLQLQGETPIVIVGDMNLVGDRRQLETLVTGNIINEFTYGADFAPDWDGTDLMDSRPVTTNLPMAFTWFNEGSSFSPGRLDFIIYSDTRLQLENSFALFTRSLPPDSLDIYNLFEEDVPFASDHLPLVADFTLNEPTAVQTPSLIEKFEIQNINPNPTSGQANINLVFQEASFFKIKINNLIGQEFILYEGFGNRGTNEIQIDLSSFAPGLYVLKLHTNGIVDSKKLLISR